MKIVCTKSVCGGVARIAGTRVTVSGILDALACGMTVDQIYMAYKHGGVTINKQDIEYAVRYSSNVLSRGR